MKVSWYLSKSLSLEVRSSRMSEKEYSGGDDRRGVVAPQRGSYHLSGRVHRGVSYLVYGGEIGKELGARRALFQIIGLAELSCLSSLVSPMSSRPRIREGDLGGALYLLVSALK